MKLLALASSLLFSCAVLAAHAAPPGEASKGQLQSADKAVVTAFFTGLLGATDPDLLARHVHPQVIEHNALVPSGRAGTAGWIRTLRQAAPAQSLRIKRMLADGDMVFVHSHLSTTPDNEMSGTNRYDFYRLDKGRIVEHWDVQAPAPTRSANGNSAFIDLFAYPGTAPVVPAARVAMNRLLVQGLSEEVFGKRNFSLLDRLWGPDYIQHNPYVGNGRAALKSVIQYIAPAGSHYRVARAMAEGDLAVVCSHNVPAGGNPANKFSGLAVCDIYRVANVELVEHWDVAQQVPTSSVNGNSMFSSLYRKH